MGAVVVIDAARALGLEIALLLAAFRGGFAVAPGGGWSAWAAGAAFVAAVVAVWAHLLAPASARRLDLGQAVAVKAALILLGTAALLASGWRAAAFGLARAAAARLVFGIVVARGGGA
jgi:hypothetical protein